MNERRCAAVTVTVDGYGESGDLQGSSEKARGYGPAALFLTGLLPNAYNRPPGRFPTIPSATKSTDNANAGGAATPTLPKNHTNAAWLVPMPLKVMGSSITSRISGMNAKYTVGGSGMPRPDPRK